MQKISQHAIKKTIGTMNKLREKIQNMRYITACKILYIKYVFFKIISAVKMENFVGKILMFLIVLLKNDCEVRWF